MRTLLPCRVAATGVQFGADEAGKGPVLGSMFAAAVRAPPDALPAGIDDSKRLSDDRREELADAIRGDDRVAVGLAEVTPLRIDDGNMNDLTVAAHAEALGDVVRDGDAGLCDAGDVDASRFARRVAGQLDADIDLEARHGADESDQHVGAASIVAKSARERHVRALAAEYGATFGAIGSGYPGDPATREFLERYVAATGELPGCARTSWSTCDAVLASVTQTELEEF